MSFANCWAHIRRYWLKADSKNGKIGLEYCDQLYRLERQYKLHLSLGKRRKAQQKQSKPIVVKFQEWVDKPPFFGKTP
ncbi:IS66 family transposase [Lysinibacillus xylanilyticus]|uniref:IS66 family transposase n=1 Tax=Lysinibacillus xylanilyticus TaxID=582475 RepID=UPI0037F1457F